MTKQHSLYLVEHRVSGRCYVGWTSKKPEERWAKHRAGAHYDANTYFLRALRKYGPEAFDWSVVQCFDTDAEAKLAEVYWIQRLRAFGTALYNLTEGGDGTPGHKSPKSPEHRAKISATLTGRPSPNRGRRHSDEAKAKMGAARRGRPGAFKGRQHSEETKEKLRRPKSAEHRARLSAANRGKPSPMKGRRGPKASAETREKMRHSALKRWRERKGSV